MTMELSLNIECNRIDVHEELVPLEDGPGGHIVLLVGGVRGQAGGVLVLFVSFPSISKHPDEHHEA